MSGETVLPMTAGAIDVEMASVWPKAVLPDELLLDAFQHLDILPHNQDLLYNETTFAIADGEIKDLKSASLVCKRWRRLLLPVLFKHVRLVVEHLSDDHHLDLNLKAFLKRGILSPSVKTLALVVKHDDPAMQKNTLWDAGSFWKSMLEEIEPLKVLLVAPPAAMGSLTSCSVEMKDAPLFDISCQYLQLERQDARRSGSNNHAIVNGKENATLNSLSRTTASIPAHKANSETLEGMLPADGSCQSASERNESVLDNDRMTSESSTRHEDPDVDHGSMMATGTQANDHVMDTDTVNARQSTASCTIFSIRPWTRMILNEGSFIPSYINDAFLSCKPPSVCLAPTHRYQLSTKHHPDPQIPLHSLVT